MTYTQATKVANLIGGGPNDGRQLPVNEHSRFIEGIAVLLADTPEQSWQRQWAYQRIGETSDYRWRGWVDELDVNEPDWRSA